MGERTYAYVSMYRHNPLSIAILTMNPLLGFLLFKKFFRSRVGNIAQFV